MRIPFEDVVETLIPILQRNGLQSDRADRCAHLFAAASRDGVESHGLNRFSSFVNNIRKGIFKASAQPKQLAGHGALERWDGMLGIGPLNASFAMSRAVELAQSHAVGCVALSRTNHWMRAGSYGWQAAEAGMIAFCWTNTTYVMPPWGSDESKLGNNPLVLAVPRSQGHLVLDMAMSQFSIGRLMSMKRAGEALSVPGGYDEQGQLSTDPEALLNTRRVLPIGFWKGSGLALMLDAIAAVLSGGLASHQVATQPDETGVSQVFIAIDAARVAGAKSTDQIAEAIVADLHSARPATADDQVLYPGQRALAHRCDSMAHGIAVDPEIWNRIKSL